jgi:hypothetical protein
VSVRYLQECDLKTLGITKMGPRKTIFQAIHKLRGTESCVRCVLRVRCVRCVSLALEPRLITTAAHAPPHTRVPGLRKQNATR